MAHVSDKLSDDVARGDGSPLGAARDDSSPNAHVGSVNEARTCDGSAPVSSELLICDARGGLYKDNGSCNVVQTYDISGSFYVVRGTDCSDDLLGQPLGLSSLSDTGAMHAVHGNLRGAHGSLWFAALNGSSPNGHTGLIGTASVCDGLLEMCGSSLSDSGLLLTRGSLFNSREFASLHHTTCGIGLLSVAPDISLQDATRVGIRRGGSLRGTTPSSGNSADVAIALLGGSSLSTMCGGVGSIDVMEAGSPDVAAHVNGADGSPGVPHSESSIKIRARLTMHGQGCCMLGMLCE